MLCREIIARSQSKVWDVARTEWVVVGIENVDEPETCLCGHYPITEILILMNKYSKNTVRVGNVCVNKFITRNNNFNGYKRILKDQTKSVNYELLKIAHTNKWISDWDFGFYSDIIAKRNLSVRQSDNKQRINRVIINKIKTRSKPK